jgi:diguanylate cyclase (GGDEF)-like protein
MVSTILIAILISISVYFGVIRNRVDKLYFEEAYSDNQEITNSAKLYFESKINEQISVIKGVEVAHHNIENNDGVFDSLYYETVIDHNEYIEALEIFDNGGTILYSSLVDENRMGINISNYPLILQIEKEHELHIGSLVFNPTFNTLCLEVVYSGENYSVLALISVSYFQAYGEEFKNSFNDKEMMILDANGIFLYDSYNEEHLIQRRYNEFNSLIESDVRTYQAMTVNDKESIVSFDKINLIDGYIVIYETLDSSLSISTIMNSYYSIVTFTIVMVFILTFVVMFYRFNVELMLIITNFEIIGSGNFDEQLKDSRIKEFSVLRHSFNDTSVKIKSLTDSLEYIAYHDQLTTLPSRNKAEIDFKKLNSKNIAFIYFDIERFTLINENYGFEIGNEILKDVALLLESFSNNVYRVEGDEYLMMNQYDSFTEIQELIKIIQEKVKKGFIINSYRIFITFKIGVSTFPDLGLDFPTLLQNAFTPLHFYKKDQTVDYLMYDEVLSEKYNRLSKVELLLNNTNISKEFMTVYQPIIEVKTEKIRGFESLSRWSNKELGVISPAEFIPILEKTRRIHIIDSKVLCDAIKVSKFIEKEFSVKLTASVNMSVYTIMRDDFIEMVDGALDRFDYDPSLLELEITESAFIEDFTTVSSKMDYLKSKGVKFSEDDFGEAYSSLTYLTKLNIDTLKISRMFLSSILDSVESRVLVQTIVELSKSLGFYTIVEGVEDIETLNLFKKYGCDFVQGYLFYRPMKEDALIQLFDVEKEEE